MQTTEQLADEFRCLLRNPNSTFIFVWFVYFVVNFTSRN